MLRLARSDTHLAPEGDGARAMGLKQAIIFGMKAKQLRKAVRKLNVAVENFREKDSLAAGLSRSSRATIEALFEFLSEKDVKRLCDRQGVDSKGRRQELIARLSKARDTPFATGGNGFDSERSAAASKKVPNPTENSGRGGSNVPDLKFGPSTDRAGFTPAGIAAFSDLRPAAVVRELIQNSMDAALIEAKETCAHVRFTQIACALDDVPGIESYRNAFRKAVQEQLPSGSARAVVERIERALRENLHDVLCVTDNGIGLDGKRMSALLSDGVSAKSGNAAGTFGNGHSVVVPASNLRYVLYGGLTECGKSYGSGQAVLASHRVDGEELSRSGRGVYLESFSPSDADVPFTLVEGEAIPPMISSAIERIRSEHGHGAAVIIPAFNNFEHDQPLREAVFRAAAFNFFQAIHEGLLVVKLEDESGSGVLDAGSLRNELAPYRNEMRSGRTGAFLSGRKANEAYETLVDGESHEIQTAQGEVAVRLLPRETGRRSVGLCRNGMWITDELPMFQNAFTDRQPFQALLLLSSDRETPFFDLIQEAETPLHDKLALKQMDPGHRKALREALGEIRDRIAELVPASTEDLYSPEDILAFQFEDVEGQGRGGRQPSYQGQVGSSRRPTTKRQKGAKVEPGGPGQGGGQRGRKKSKGRIMVEPVFRIASVPTGKRRRTIQVECTKDFEDAKLLIFVDENVDATCDRQTRAQSSAVLLSNVTVDGRRLDEDELVKNGEETVGAKLGSLAMNTRILVETDYEIPSSTMHLLPGQDPALRIEVLSTRESVPMGTGKPDGGASVIG